MKISKLHIDSFRHLENLDFDFTYPEDFHIVEKRGKPLDKICFIGQSATGKTGLLELIYECNVFSLNVEIVEGISLTNRIKFQEIKGEILFHFNGKDIYKQNSKEIFYKNKLYKDLGIGGSVTSLIPIQDKKNIYYFKSNLISEKNIEIFTINPIDLIEKYKNEIIDIQYFFSDNGKYATIFDNDVNNNIWLFLLNEILNYRKNFTQKMSELIHKGLLADTKKLNVEFQKWQKENPNKLEDFAENFNPILEKLHLEVDVISTEHSIPIRNKINEEIIPIQNTSTGTKGLLLSFLPIYKLDTKDSIILIDEPERSLYPDMQMDLMENYQKLAPDAQFIVATHSPFISASFEPEERYILYFNEEGKVAVRRGSSPIGDDPNDMLYNDFGIDYINKHGKKVHTEYLDKKRQLLFEENDKVKNKLQNEIEEIGDKYNF